MTAIAYRLTAHIAAAQRANARDRAIRYGNSKRLPYGLVVRQYGRSTNSLVRQAFTEAFVIAVLMVFVVACLLEVTN